jgi:hypothetical protein
MRCLPLGGSAMVVARPMLGMVFIVVMMILLAVMIMRMVAMHGASQYATGLLMIFLWLPSLPWATIEPSASTTTRTPISAVMSEVS